MFGSDFIEVAISLAFIYLLLSLVCTALNEMIAQLLKLRAETLKQSLTRLLTDEKIRKQFYEHPLIKGLGKGPGKDGVVRPSYIPSQTFVLALLDTVIRPDQSGKTPDADAGATEPPTLTAIKEVRELWDVVAKHPEPAIRKLLLPFIEASDSLEQARKNIETWFDSAMDRASGWYRRKVQFILLLIAIVVAVAMNADTITLTTQLWQDSALRQAVVAAADDYMAGAKDLEDKTKTLDSLQEQIRKLELPIGWAKDRVPPNPLGWLSKIIGLLFTAIAISLGAPFWFDTLNRIMKLRGTGPAPKTSTVTAATEAQT